MRTRINSDTFALEYVQTGSFEFIQNSNCYTCVPGDLFIVQLGGDSSIRTREAHATKKTIGIAGRMLPALLDSFKLTCDMIPQLPAERFDPLFDRTFELLEERPDDCLNELSTMAYRILLELSQVLENPDQPEILTEILRHFESKRPASYMSASKSSRVPGELEKLCGKRRPIGRQQGFGLICRS